MMKRILMCCALIGALAALSLQANAQGIGMLAPGHVIGNGTSTNPAEATDASIGSVLQQASPLPTGITFTSPTLTNPTVTGSFTATGLVTNSDLTNSQMTINGTVCTLGGTCSPSTSSTIVTIGSTTISGGSGPGHALYDNSGVLGEISTSVTVNGTTCTLGSTCAPSAAATTITIGTTSIVSGTANSILSHSGSGNTVAELTTGNNQILATNGSGVPAFTATLPTAVQGNITSTGILTGGETGAGFTLAFGSSTMTGQIPVANGGWGLATLTSGAIYKGNGTSAPAVSALSDNGTLVSTSEPFDLTSKSVITEIANEGVTGTTINKLAKLTGAPSTAKITATTDTGGVVGVVVGGAGTTSNAQIAISGQATCAFDSGTTAGDYVQISSTVSGDCLDAGASYPASHQVIGRVLATIGSAGNAAIEIFPPEIQASTGGGGGGGSVTGVTIIAGTGISLGGSCSSTVSISCTVNTSWSVSGSNIYNNNVGNVGIGTSSPADTLSVFSTNNCCGANAIGLSGNAAGVSLGLNNTASGGHDWRLISSATASGAPGLRFFDETTTSDKFFIGNSGNIGIGTISPANELDVATSNAGIHLASNPSCSTSNALCNNAGDLTWNGASIPSCVNATMVGFVGNGSTNNHTAWTNWFSSLSGAGGCLAFPPGTFDDSTGNDSYTITSSVSGVRIVGAGVNATKLTWSNGGGLTINYFDVTDSFELGNLYYATGSTSGTGLTLQITPGNSIVNGSAAKTNIHDVFFSGPSCSISTGHWSTAIAVHGVENIAWNNDSICGTGATSMTGVHIDGSTQTLTTNAATTGSAVLHFASVPSTATVGMGCWDQNNVSAIQGNGFSHANSIVSTTSTTITLGLAVSGTVNSGDVIQCANDNAVYHFSNVSFWDSGPAIDIGTGTQGVVIDSNTTSTVIGLSGASFVQTSSNVFGLDGLTIVGTQVASGNTYCVISNSEWVDFTISSNIMYCNGTSLDGINMGPSVRGNISNNNIINGSGSSTSAGIRVNGELGVATGNIIQGFLDGVFLDSSSSDWNVQSNAYGVTGTKCVAGGSGNTCGGGSP